jgi:predicted HTH domain antitoxin
VTLELPDLETKNLTPEELRLELACGLYARGKISAVGGAHVADVDLFTFQGALAARGIPRNYTMEDLQEDIAGLKTLFPE